MLLLHMVRPSTGRPLQETINRGSKMNKDRFHGLDFCRAVLMTLGLFFHCGLIYGSGQDWRVVSDETMSVIKFIANFIHHFRMEAFYLVSGFFYLLILCKGRDSFLKDRLVRALIPMLVIGLTLNVMMNHLSDNRTYDWGVNYFMNGKWLGHLWFLGNLIVYFMVSIPISKLIAKKAQRLSSAQFYIAIGGLITVALIGNAAAKHFGWSTVLFINLGYLFYFYPFFLMGVLAYAAKKHFYSLISIRKLPFFLAAYAVMQGVAKIDVGLTLAQIDFIKQVSHFPLMVSAFSFLNFIGDRESRVIKLFSDASYTIYLLHQPLIILFYVAFFDSVSLGAMTEYLLLIVSVFAASLLFHLLVVEKSATAKLLLNGVQTKSNVKAKTGRRPPNKIAMAQ